MGAGQVPPTAQPSKPREKLRDVLDLLVAMNVIYMVENNNDDGGNDSAGTNANAGKSNNGALPQPPPAVAPRDPNPTYFFGDRGGGPRADVVLPTNVLDQVKEAGEEVLRTKERIEILRKELQRDDEKAGGVDGEEGNAVTNEDQKDKHSNDNEEATDMAGSGGGGGGSRKRKRAEDLSKKPHKSVRQTLKLLLEMHPEIVYDPCYAAA